jgi:hypothetical protein
MATRSLLPALAGFLAGTLTTAAVASGGPDVAALLAHARAEARAIDELAFSLRDPGARAALHGRAVRLDGELAGLEHALTQRPSRALVGDTELGGMVSALRGEAFSGDRLARLGDLARGRRFTSAQVGLLLDAFAFDSDKVEAAARLYPQVVDPQQFWTVYDALTFSSSKEALRSRIASTPGW